MRFWLASFMSFLLTKTAMATANGAPRAWEINLQHPFSPSAEHIVNFHNMLLVIISIITVFVLALLVYVMIRFRAGKNPVPSKTSHNVTLEIVWTLIPVLILLIIIVPSIRLLYYTDRAEQADMTIKAIGHQWYWEYEYPDQGDISFTANLIADKDIDPSKNQLRLLSTDNWIVVPAEKNIRVLVTASDVLHAWAVPALGVKKDAVPGRLNETWIRVEEPGIYYGQCSELCGVNHGFMPIEIHAVTQDQFDRWAAMAKKDTDKAQAMLAAELANPAGGPVLPPAPVEQKTKADSKTQDIPAAPDAVTEQHQ